MLPRLDPIRDSEPVGQKGVRTRMDVICFPKEKRRHVTTCEFDEARRSSRFDAALSMSPISRMHRLRAHVRDQAENRPGVYRMVGSDDEVLYVGKSIRVRSRLLSYFRSSPREKPGELIRSTRQIAWDYVPNEFDALLTEMRLIQRWQPRYNVEHKRKKRYAFVKITTELAPRIVPTSRVVQDGSTYFGPFPAFRWLSDAVRSLAHTLQLRDCPGSTPVHFGDQLELLSSHRAPRCLRADLGSCLAPCCGSPTASEYLKKVAAARSFLEGRGHQPLRQVEEQMREASRRQDFEYAALIRDRLDSLQRFRDELTAFRGAMESLSFVYRVPGFGGDDRLYLIRRGRVRSSLPAPRSRAERARTIGRVEEVFGEADCGPAGLHPQEAAEILLVARWFRLRPNERKRAVPPEDWVKKRAGR